MQSAKEKLQTLYQIYEKPMYHIAYAILHHPQQAEDAARTVGLHDAIAALPEGYDTPCTPGIFSQGQWQLLSIARAIAAGPQILLLDEITANLDAGTEQTVLDALQCAGQNRTVVSISHRLYNRTGGRSIEI